jgi:hypothetical protein
MRADGVVVQLRPRNPWEAMDLGFAMARRWWLPLWGAWFAVCLPTAIVLSLAFRSSPWLAAVALWWLKPLLDRFVLHVASHAVFGETPGVRSTLAAWREILSPGLIAALTLYRFDLARSFLLPVWQLERQKGRDCRARRQTLQRRMRSYAVWLTVICINVEALAMLSGGLLVDLLKPAESDTGFNLLELFSGAASSSIWDWRDVLAYAAAMSAIEPLYVTAGFSLYLNRRMTLEGWDVELGLRRLSERFAPGAAVLAALALGCALSLGSFAREAGAASGSPKEEIARVLASPEFSTQREISTWRYRGAPREERTRRTPLAGGFWTAVGKFLAALVQTAGWVGLGVLVVVLAWYAWRLLPSAPEARPPPEAVRPPTLRAAAAREPLPTDVAGAAAALAVAGRRREALSLLYRGALTALARQYAVEIGDGDTETECLERARRALPAPSLAYFDALVQAWRRAAYAAQPLDTGSALQLCRGWDEHFSSAARAAT